MPSLYHYQSGNTVFNGGVVVQAPRAKFDPALSAASGANHINNNRAAPITSAGIIDSNFLRLDTRLADISGR